MFYRVKWTVSWPERTRSHEYIASMEDAWELWYWLTSRLEMEPEYRRRMEEQKRESVLFEPPARTITVRVYELNGVEVSPEKGLSGMICPKG